MQKLQGLYFYSMFAYLFMLLLSAPMCAEQGSLSDAMLRATNDALSNSSSSGKHINITYPYDATHTLHIDVEKQTVRLTDANKQIVAEGGYKQADATGNQLYPHGYWKYYHPNGRLKEEGSYVVAPYAWVDTAYVINPATNTKEMKTNPTLRYQSIPTGVHRYYHPDGSLAGEEVRD